MSTAPINNLVLQKAGVLQSGLVHANGSDPADAFSYALFNVLAYGADPTGTSDSAAAIQAAVVAAEVNGGGIVYFPAGTYKLASAVTVASSVGVTFRGIGEGSVLKSATQALGALLSFTGQNIRVCSLTLDGSYTSGSSSGTSGLIELTDAQRVVIEDCTIKNSLRNGIRLYGDCAYIRITGCLLTNNYCSIRQFEDQANNTTCTAVAIVGNRMISNWNRSGDDQTGGIKMQTTGVTTVSRGHLIADNYLYRAGYLSIELWTGENGKIADTVIRGNRIFGTDSIDSFGISLNGCYDTIAIANVVRLPAAFVGIEVANECVRCQVKNNDVNLFATDGTSSASGTAVGVYNNVGNGPQDTSIVGNDLCGGDKGIQVQGNSDPAKAAKNTYIVANRLRDFDDTLIYLQNASKLAITMNRLEATDCSMFLYIDGGSNDITDIDVGYNTFVGNANFRCIFGYNNSTAYTFTNFHFHHNDGKQCTFTGYDSWDMQWSPNELVNMIREDNYYLGTAGTANWGYLTSVDVPVPPFSPQQQQYSIPIASKFVFTAAANAGDQWFKIFSISYGLPLTLALHVQCNFLANDNAASAQTFNVSGSPYGQDAGIMKLPDGWYQGGLLKELIYDNPGSGATQELWLRIGPTGGGDIAVGGADFASSWILTPSAVTTEPTWGTNHYKFDAKNYQAYLKSRYSAFDILAGVEQASAPAAPATDGFKIYAKDSGGKTALYVRFATGAEQQIAIEP